MTEPTRTPAARVVVAAVDGSEHGTRALDYAVAEARRRGLGLRIVHVRPDAAGVSSMAPTVPDLTLHEFGVEVVKEAEDHARTTGWTGPDLEVVLETGPKLPRLLHHLNGAACVVIGRRASAVEHFLTGSTTSSLAAHADVPVLCVPASWPSHGRPGLVGCGLESFDHADHILAVAFDQAQGRHARLEVLHAWRPVSPYDVAVREPAKAGPVSDSVRDALSSYVEMHRGSDVEWFVNAVFDRPAPALRELSTRAELLVVGRRGRTSPPFRHLGPVTAALLRSADCPVLVVPEAHRASS